MELDIAMQDVWVAAIEDRAGGLAEKLETLAHAGANLEFVIARRSPEMPGTAVVFVTPIEGAQQVKAAQEARFDKASSLYSLRVATADKPGLGVRLTRKLAEEGINLRGFSGAVIGQKAVFNLAFDSSADADKAMRRLREIS